MNRSIFRTAFLLVAGIAILSSCEPKETVKTFKLTIGYTSNDVPAANIEDVTIVLNSDSSSDTLHFSKLENQTLEKVQGNYVILVNGKVAGEATAQVQGTATLALYEDKEVNVPLNLFYSSPLLFKTIYCTGGAQYYVLDSYIEIVNNSDEVQYLDGLILAAPLANLKAQSVWQDTYPDKYNCGQGSVLAFPGNGKDYPIQPGEFIIMADQAMNHKLAYGSDDSKKEEYAKSPDLSGAHFEKYYGNGDVDNEKVPNMEVVYSNNKSMKMWGFGVSGRAFLLAKLPAGMTPAQFAADENNFATQPGSSSTTLNMLIPNQYVLDAVDVYANGVAASDHYPFFLPKDDASGVEGSGSYAGKCIRRKVEKIGDRVYYQDTNNSANDFKTNQDNTAGFVPTTADK